ncbi:hypothetical protein C5S32_03255 [ANME-1 cluster archaeon GoMg1]|nr:hypothetical protein [ANME-1 cluster archaeon GoMg1]
MSKIKGFDDLKVWEKSHEFVLEVCKITRQFPGEEKFGLTSQIRRQSQEIAKMLSGLINSLKNLKPIT